MWLKVILQVLSMSFIILVLIIRTRSKNSSFKNTVLHFLFVHEFQDKFKDKAQWNFYELIAKLPASI